MTKSYNRVVIDSHVHIGENEYTTVSFTFDTFLNFMNKYNIDFAVAMPNPSKIKSHRDSNTYIMKEYRNFSDSRRFFPFLLIDPFDRYTLDQIKEKDVIDILLGADGLKNYLDRDYVVIIQEVNNTFIVALDDTCNYFEFFELVLQHGLSCFQLAHELSINILVTGFEFLAGGMDGINHDKD